MTFSVEKYLAIIGISAFVVNLVVLPIYSAIIRSHKDGGGRRSMRDDDNVDTDTKCFRTWIWTSIISSMFTSAITMLVSTYIANKK